jgi:hypothetical protein
MIAKHQVSLLIALMLPVSCEMSQRYSSSGGAQSLVRSQDYSPRQRKAFGLYTTLVNNFGLAVSHFDC